MQTETITPQFLHNLSEREIAAWEECYDQYSPALFGVILSNVPEEISVSVLKETFLEMYKCIRDYSAGKERFFTWMYRTTLKVCALEKNKIETLQSSPPYLPESGQIVLPDINSAPPFLALRLFSPALL